MDPGTDLTGDGQPELVVAWPGSPPVYQVYRPQNDRLALLGELAAEAQLADLEGDGAVEFLTPDAPFATFWREYRWSGQRFEWAADRFVQAAPQALPVTEPDGLPPLPANLYFNSAGQWYVWPARGGQVSVMSADPPPAQACSGGTLTADPACPSPNGRYDLVSLPGEGEGVWKAVREIETGAAARIPASFIYPSGRSDFAWSPGGAALYLARAGDGGALYRVNPATGVADLLFSAVGCGLNPENCSLERASLGFFSPYPHRSGWVGFAVQSAGPGLYPPPGVYRLEETGELSRIAGLPLLSTACLGEGGLPAYGQLSWSPDGSLFLYQSPFVEGRPCPGPTLLLGRVDGSALWDVSGALDDTSGVPGDFRWGG
jgi:hypothetical protein